MERNAARRANILDRTIVKHKAEVSLSAFSLLFSELVQYNQNRASSVSDLEKLLESSGYGVGLRIIELISCRDKVTKRETRIVNMLQYVSNVIWKELFGKAADNLERSTENEDEYMIHEYSPVTNTFVSVPADMGSLNCASFLAGIIAGVLDSSRFNARVTAHLVSSAESGQTQDRTVFLIKFAPEVMSRERKLG